LFEREIIQGASFMLLFEDIRDCEVGKPFRKQLLKWVGNKQRFANQIVSYFPPTIGTYFEPFLGSAAVLATLAPRHGVASDSFEPLMEIWSAVKKTPDVVADWYTERWQRAQAIGKAAAYAEILTSYNRRPNGPDLLFLCRACYGGVVRFRKADGFMSTPCGVHSPISPASFRVRLAEWCKRVAGTEFVCADFRKTMSRAKEGDLVYCDPPYRDSQTILYGAQTFSLDHLFSLIGECKSRGVYVALSIDGTKKSGKRDCLLHIPPGLFEREFFVNCGRSMLKRFQMNGRTLADEVVADRLLLTF
jgi:DNA adenine methylase